MGGREEDACIGLFGLGLGHACKCRQPLEAGAEAAGYLFISRKIRQQVLC